MKKNIFSGVVKEKKQLKNSVSGGPREMLNLTEVTFSANDGVQFTDIIATTASNSSAGYCLSCSMDYLENKKMIFEAHYTKKGSLIIDRIISGYYKRG